MLEVVVPSQYTCISPKVFEVPYNVLFALFLTFTYKVDLLAIETGKNFTDLSVYFNTFMKL